MATGAPIDATLGCAVNPTIFVKAEDATGLAVPTHFEYSNEIAEIVDSLREQVRLHSLCLGLSCAVQGAAAMGLELNSAVRVAFVAPPSAYSASDGSEVT